MYSTVQSHDFLSLFVSIFNHCLQSKRKIGVFPYHQQLVCYLSFFYKQGYILSYKQCSYVSENGSNKKTYLFVWFKFYENISIIRFLKLYSKPSKRMYMSYKKLKYYSHHYKKKKILISTVYGLLSLNDCLLRKMGGMLLFEIL